MTAKPYAGGCQCGAVRFEATADLDSTISCNCSRCGRLGSILAFAPASAFTLLSGDDALTEYRFHSHHVRHLFCKVCGIQSFARGIGPDGTETVAINARCLDGVDPDALTPEKFDGRSR
ncbi:MAG TPA: GFA family protein [Xanthobacteraceae bacterium]|jgi:hypothetical protein|nr:GFA family protein [Xanthobacteraceae bacterium]